MSIQAIGRHPEVELKVSGPGWEGFENARQAEKKYKPDLIRWYKPLNISGYAGVNTPRCIAYNEMWSKEWTAKEIRSSKSGLVICHHNNDIHRYAGRLDPRKFKLVHNPHCGETRVFKDYGLEKTVDVLFVGINNKKFYPLRDKLKHSVGDILLKRGINFKVFKHPGYKLKGLEVINQHVEKYARALNRAKIVVTCGSIFHYALAKYVEVPLCRSALCADLPGENKEWYEKWMIVIDNSMTPRAIADRIQAYLDSPETLKRRTELGYEENLKHRTQESYARRFITLAQDYLEGRMEDYDFTIDSERYLNGGDLI